MNRRVAAVLLAAVLVVPAVAGVALTSSAPVAAQQDNSTQSGDGEQFAAPGPYRLERLQSVGTHPGGPQSVRYINPDDPAGSVALRYRPASPLKNDMQFLTPGQTVHSGQVQLYSTYFGDGDEDYELVIVYWNRQTADVNGTERAYAANQTVQRADIEFDGGYATTNVSLMPHYSGGVETTMWLEADGERVDGAQWRFEHRSISSSEGVNITTRADAWWYALKTAILPGVAGVILGLSGARLTLRRTGTGPRLGMAVWGLLGGVIILVAAGGLWYEVAQVLAHAEVLMGLALGIVAYGGGLRFSQPVERLVFERKELTKARSLRGERQ